MKTVDLGNGFLLDIPDGWNPNPRSLLSQAFIARFGAIVTDAFHPTRSRPTVPPYIVIEQLSNAGVINPTPAQQLQFAQQVAAYYATSFNPPSKAARTAGFKNAKVSTISVDPVTQRHSFSVIVKYDSSEDQYVDVSVGCGPAIHMVAAIWTDADYHAANAKSIAAIRDSIRPGTAAVKPTPAGVGFKRFTQVSVALVVLLIAVIQAYVLWKERRERLAEEARLLS